METIGPNIDIETALDQNSVQTQFRKYFLHNLSESEESGSDSGEEEVNLAEDAVFSFLVLEPID